MTGSKSNHEGNSSGLGEPDLALLEAHASRLALLGWRVAHVCALAIYVLSGDLSWLPRSQPQQPQRSPRRTRTGLINRHIDSRDRSTRFVAVSQSSR